jgi:hypothetical protein
MPNRGRNEALLGVGIAIGAAALAVGSRYLVRRAHQVTEDGLVDWRRVEQLASIGWPCARRLSDVELMAAGLPTSSAMDQGRAAARAASRLAAAGVVERHGVVSREEWARANITTFQQLISHSSRMWPASAKDPASRRAWPSGRTAS